MNMKNYKEIKFYISPEKIEQVRSICNKLFLDYFELDFSIDADLNNTSYEIHLKNFTANGSHYDDYRIGVASDMRYIVKYLVKGIYREQNGLEAEY